ncbi:TetR/AcrR family transcriptional regulator [Caulobacter sp. 1776]|uniref:TetR/AcrR family transcriptional regulator n=1 Tax=Caulobacter sp. 1776 TaxID=3156420 RepID=UPI003393C96E
MVQKTEPKKRGRPRAYDPEAALAKATETFWESGYAAASLDALSAATGMNRPSLYGAFGDKQALFQAAMQRYQAQARATMRTALGAPGTLRESLTRFYAAGLEVYLDGGPRGCFLIGSGLSQAAVDPAIRDTVAAGVHELDAGLTRRLTMARDAGELPASADPATLARVVSGMLNALAVRARLGESRAELEAMAATTIDLVCGA